MAAMTNRDIRDIAGYWGAPCTEPNGLYKRVDSTTLEALEIGVDEFKVCLRQMASLTDVEVRECAKLALPGFELDFFSRPIQIDGRSVLQEYRLIYRSGIAVNITAELPFAVSIVTRGLHLPDTGAIVAYLQSIGVYVPGTISEKYVNLVE